MATMISVATGLTVACWLFLAFSPATPLRLIIFGGLAVGTALLGLSATDKVRE
jgi:hypothetical protein